MTLALVAFLFIFSQILDAIVEYDPLLDNNPRNIRHKIIRRISEWISKDDKTVTNT